MYKVKSDSLGFLYTMYEFEVSFLNFFVFLLLLRLLHSRVVVVVILTSGVFSSALPGCSFVG